MYHANLFKLVKHTPFPVFRYAATVDPQPANRPQLYQILGATAKQITYREKKPVVLSEGEIVSLAFPISQLSKHLSSIPDVGQFSVSLTEADSSPIRLEQFDEYRLIVDRLADLALTVFSSEYYKFHPLAPYVLRDEPYFDAELIERTGIVDSKKYYRGLHRFNNQPVFVLNRETQLRSHRNLLNEIKSLKKHFESMKKIAIDFYNPPKDFVEYVNSLLRGKSADVLAYPGPSVRDIKEISWKYRARDVTPGSTKSHIDYLHDTYGVGGLDPNQPLVVYEIEREKRTQYHVPEVLSVGHNFTDLERRIPSWQRKQVWGIIHPDCKNQLQKIYEVLSEIDRALRIHLPLIYPQFVEISREPLDVSSLVSKPVELTLQFGNKDLVVKSPYDVSFYHSYTNKKLSFAKPLGNVKALLCAKNKSSKLNAFMTGLAREFKLRNGSELTFDVDSLDLDMADYSNYDVIITIGNGSDEGDMYERCKEILQNARGMAHQHVTEEHANEDSVMALIMELNIKLGGDPWLLPAKEMFPYVAGVHSYLNPFSKRAAVFAMLLDGRGSLLKQFDPIRPTDFKKIATQLASANKSGHRMLYLFSYDRFGILQELQSILDQEGDVEYCIAEIDDQDYLRFFQTWIPKKAPRFGKQVSVAVESPIEAYQSAPQGVALRSDDSTFFLITGKTLEKDATKRGCPRPIRLSIVGKKGEGWNTPDVVNYVFALSMMGRSSGHMTRFPSPIYYLQSYAHYYNSFGVPKDEHIKQRIFYL
jgi:hypothetical protein